MNHLLLYQNTAVAAGATDSDINAVTDQKVTIANNHFIMPQDTRLLAAHFVGASLIRGKIVTPYLRQISPSYVDPFERAATIPTLPNVAMMMQNGPTLKAGDETAVQLSNNLGAATERETAAIWVDLNGPPLHPGPYTTVRLTGTTAAAINVWTLCPLTFDNVLPFGRYAIAGMKVACDNTGWARLVIPELNYRPGVPIQGATGRNDWRFFRYGNFGSFGEFQNLAQPMLEVFALTAITTQEVYLDVVKIG